MVAVSLKKKTKKIYDIFDRYNKDELDPPSKVYIWGKDVVLFPKKINGKYALLHRILPNIHIAFFKNFKDLTKDYWRNHFKNIDKYILIPQKYWFETRTLGAGCPPIETDKGWLLIYHAVQFSRKGNVYRAAAALLDKKDPRKVIGRLKKPLFSPEKKWELKGDVNNVVFPTGTALFGEKLYIYYGAADKRIAVASVNLNSLLDELLKR